MSTGRADHQAVLLDDGRVLAVGGRGKKLTSEIYDPETNTWEKTGNTVQPHAEGAIIRLSTGKVLLTGGIGYGLRAAALYDTATGVWEELEEMNNDRYRHEMIRLKSDLILIIGGQGREGVTAEVESFTP